MKQTKNKPLFLVDCEKRQVGSNLLSFHNEMLVALHENNQVFVSTPFYSHHLKTRNIELPELRGMNFLHTVIWEAVRQAIEDFEYEEYRMEKTFGGVVLCLLRC